MNEAFGIIIIIYEPASDSAPSDSSSRPIGVLFKPTYSILLDILFLMLRSLRDACIKTTAAEQEIVCLNGIVHSFFSVSSWFSKQ